jgi:outer membrane protein OmpA-like peptidoglycan-associated protein
MTSRQRLIALFCVACFVSVPAVAVAQEGDDLEAEIEGEASGDAEAGDGQEAEDPFPNKLPAVPTLQGGSGLFHVTSAQTGEELTFRLAMQGQFFSGSDVIRANDENSRFLGTLSISATPIEFLEPYLVLQARSNQNTFSTPETVLAQGDSNLGVKGVFEVAPAFHVGGDLRLIFLTGAGDSSFDFGATSVRIGAMATFDGTEMPDAPIPVRATLNLGYLVDNSDQILPEDEDGAKIVPSRVERFSQGLSAFSQFQIGLGVEVPLNYVTPSIEYTLGVIVGDEPPALCENQPLECPSAVGFGGNPQNLTLGVRGMPLEGLVPAIAVDIGLTSDDVQGVPVNPPYQVIFGLTYAFDPRSRETIIVEEKIVEREKIVEIAPKGGFFQGTVIDADTQKPVPGAIVEYVGRDVTRQSADEKEGSFRSYEFAPGEEVEIVVRAPDYKSTKLTQAVVEGPNELAVKLKPRGKTGILRGFAKIGAENAQGTVVLTGPNTYEVQLQDGKFEQKVLAGWYTVTMVRPGMVTGGRDVEVKPGGKESVGINLVRRPATSAVELVQNRIVVDGKIEFTENNVKSESHALLDQVAAVLFEHPEFSRVQIGAHVDDSGSAEKQAATTEFRAKAVRDYLLKKGVNPNRLEAKAFGSTQPLVPNSSGRNREINRRIEFAIVAGGQGGSE